jgi:hypothetical protein
MMRVSDLLDCEVFDAEGDSIGKVRDVRLVMDGPLRGALAQLRLDAVFVGGNAIAGRLGYVRGGVRGPALLIAIMSRLERNVRTYDVNQVAEWDLANHRLRLTSGARPEGDPDSD